MNTSGEEGGGLSPFLTTASSHEQCEGKKNKGDSHQSHDDGGMWCGVVGCGKPESF